MNTDGALNARQACRTMAEVSSARLQRVARRLRCYLLLIPGFIAVLAAAQEPGTVIWEQSLSYVGVLSPPTVASDGTIYFYGGATNLYAFTSGGSFRRRLFVSPSSSYPYDRSAPVIMADGRLLVPSGNILCAYSPWLNYSSNTLYAGTETINRSLVIGEDGTIYFGTESKVRALKSDGTLHWTYARPGDCFSMAPDGTLYFLDRGTRSGVLRALNASGQWLWSFPSGWFSSYAAIGRDGTVYSSAGSRLFALDPDSANPNGTKKWEFVLPGVSCGECRGAPVVAADGTIYIAANDVLLALRPNGTKKWEFQFGSEADGVAPAIGVDGTVYVGSRDSYLYAVARDGSYRWRYFVGDYPSAAVGVNGVLYVTGTGGGFGQLVALKADTTSNSAPWPTLGRDPRHSGRVTCPAGAPCFDTEEQATNGAFEMVLMGEPGDGFVVESSTNLLKWENFTIRSTANGALHLVDSEATNSPHRFFRATRQ